MSAAGQGPGRPRRGLTKRAAETLFNESFQDRSDAAARREAWGAFTDQLCREGLISLRDYETWVYPRSWRADAGRAK